MSSWVQRQSPGYYPSKGRPSEVSSTPLNITASKNCACRPYLNSARYLHHQTYILIYIISDFVREVLLVKSEGTATYHEIDIEFCMGTATEQVNVMVCFTEIIDRGVI